MGNITKVIVEFLNEEKDCTLVTNEVSLQDVFEIARRENVEIVNPAGKVLEKSDSTDKEHYIKYA